MFGVCSFCLISDARDALTEGLLPSWPQYALIAGNEWIGEFAYIVQARGYVLASRASKTSEIGRAGEKYLTPFRV